MAKTVAIPPKKVDLAPLIAAQVVPMDCGCDGCGALAAEYGSDPQLHLTYRLALLKRGWAGKVTPGEKLFQQAHVEWARQRPAEGHEFGGGGTGAGMPEFGDFHGAQHALVSEDEEYDTAAREVSV